MFFLDNNAEITTNENNTIKFISKIQKMSPKTKQKGSSSSSSHFVEQVDRLISLTPSEFNYKEIVKKFPTMYQESMNTVLTQELLRYNKLIVIMKKQLL